MLQRTSNVLSFEPLILIDIVPPFNRLIIVELTNVFGPFASIFVTLVIIVRAQLRLAMQNTC